jgi:alcohol dehydrogenase class IV
MAAMAHGLGHALGAALSLPHGRAVGLFLPYTIEYTARGEIPTRYAQIARFLGQPAATEVQGAANLAEAIRGLTRSIGQPTSLQEAGLTIEVFEAHLPKLVENAVNDSAMVVGLRCPDEADVERVFRYAFEGKVVDF